MGAFYANITLKGTTQALAVEALRGRRAAVTRNVGDFVVAFDAVCDEQDLDQIELLTVRLSAELACTAFSVVVHDDDILYYFCCRQGERVDSYNSDPNYFGDTHELDAPLGGDAAELCKSFGATASKSVSNILHEGDYDFQTDRHSDLVQALGLPAFTVGTALATFDDNELPDGLTRNDIIRAADAPAVESREMQWDREFYEKLGDESSERRCKRENCQRGAVSLSMFCKPHHFEMVRGYGCPFKD